MTRLAILKSDRTILDRSATSTISSSTPVPDSVTGIQIGSASSTERISADVKISEIRLDRRIWSATETDRLVDFSLRDEWRSLRLVTEGKLFEVTGFSGNQISGRWSDAQDSISLEEADAIEDGALAFAR